MFLFLACMLSESKYTVVNVAQRNHSAPFQYSNFPHMWFLSPSFPFICLTPVPLLRFFFLRFILKGSIYFCFCFWEENWKLAFLRLPHDSFAELGLVSFSSGVQVDHMSCLHSVWLALELHYLHVVKLVTPCCSSLMPVLIPSVGLLSKMLQAYYEVHNLVLTGYLKSNYFISF